MPLHWALGVGRWTLNVLLLFLGRVAEFGLRHSTRNRAWGNPPWVQIPPLPPMFVDSARKQLSLPAVHWSCEVSHPAENDYSQRANSRSRQSCYHNCCRRLLLGL